MTGILIELLIICVILLLLYLYLRPVDKVRRLNDLIQNANVTPRHIGENIIKTYIESIHNRTLDHLLADRAIDVEQENAEVLVQQAILGGRNYIVNDIINRTNQFVNQVNNNRRILAAEGKKDPVKWRSDSQNVHDSDITKQIRDQYTNMKAQNDLEQIPSDVSQLLELLYYQKVDGKVLDKIRESEHNSIPERMYLHEVWRRSMSRKNQDKTKLIQDNIKQALNDCRERNNIVCVRGRVARVMGSLAVIDPEFGTFKSKQVTRNEFMEKCGHVINKHVKTKPTNTQDDYMHDKDTLEVQILKKELTQKVHNIALEYPDTNKKEMESYINMACYEIGGGVPPP